MTCSGRQFASEFCRHHFGITGLFIHEQPSNVGPSMWATDTASLYNGVPSSLIRQGRWNRNVPAELV